MAESDVTNGTVYPPEYTTPKGIIYSFRGEPEWCTEVWGVTINVVIS